MANHSNTPVPLPPQDTLHALLTYDPETGRLYWKERPVSMFPSEQSAKTWSTRYAGKEAFTSCDKHGYRQAGIFNKVYRAHRIIAVMIFGEFDGYVDHINGNRADNRQCNIRIVTAKGNQRNMKLNSRNTSGVNGVNWKRNRNKWQAYIRGEGRKTIHLGLFDTVEEAIAARMAAEAQFNYHPNHGRN